MAPQAAAVASLRGRKVAFNSKLLKIAVKDWLSNSTKASLKYGGHISEWDTSKVYNMSSLFANAVEFNDDLSGWDVSNVRDFRYAFANATSFTGYLSQWDTSNARNMKHVFHGASSFDSNLYWNTTNVLTFAYMFAGATSFNGSVHTFNVNKAHDLSFMFYNAISFNQDLSGWTIEQDDVPGFRVKWAQNMRSMFHGAASFQGNNLSNWQTYAAYNMNSMFKDASSFSGNLSSWNVQNVRNFGHMFAGSAFAQDLCWEVQNEAVTTDMFEATSASLLSDCKDDNARIAPEIPAWRSSATSVCGRTMAMVVHSVVFIACVVEAL